MNENFRDYLKRLEEGGHLVTIDQPVDIRHVSALVDQAETALLFRNVIGYDMPLLSGIIGSKDRATAALGCASYSELETKLKQGLQNPIPPKVTESGKDRDIVLTGDDVNLFKLPVPVCSVSDGGPTITAGVVIANDPEFGQNCGIYRFMLKERTLSGIDIVTPNNLRFFAQRALERGEPLPISISIGVHPSDFMCAGYRAPLGVDELAIAGGLRGAPLELGRCITSDLNYIADAEIVLEAEILPTGWTWPEGRFGEFTRLMGGLHWNPLVRVKAITMKRNPVFYSLHMPWEVTWLAAPARYAALRDSLKAASIVVHDINVTIGGCGYWHAVISIKKQPGEGKNALLAALSVMDIKHVTIVDDDIDVFNPTDVEWAVATRVQADRDVVTLSNVRAKPLDPSLPVQRSGTVPTTAKMGIDATIPEGVPRERFDRISYAYSDKVKIADYLEGRADARRRTVEEANLPKLKAEIVRLLEATPTYYIGVIEAFPDFEFSTIVSALGELHEEERIWQDDVGRMCLRGSKFAAKLPA
jgi:2,5-furandicarboxylate decarboxylase 1